MRGIDLRARGQRHPYRHFHHHLGDRLREVDVAWIGGDGQRIGGGRRIGHLVDQIVVPIARRVEHDLADGGAHRHGQRELLFDGIGLALDDLRRAYHFARFVIQRVACLLAAGQPRKLHRDLGDRHLECNRQRFRLRAVAGNFFRSSATIA